MERKSHWYEDLSNIIKCNKPNDRFSSSDNVYVCLSEEFDIAQVLKMSIKPVLTESMTVVAFCVDTVSAGRVMR